MQTNFVELVLTCGSWQEAQRIADMLLEKNLVTNVELMEVKNQHNWQGQIGTTRKVKLILETTTDNFDKVEKVVSEISSRKKKLIRS